MHRTAYHSVPSSSAMEPSCQGQPWPTRNSGAAVGPLRQASNHGGVMFRDRVDAGRRLAAVVLDLALVDPVVLGLPRGGVVVAAEVADALGASLDVIVVRKLGVPGRPELGM